MATDEIDLSNLPDGRPVMQLFGRPPNKQTEQHPFVVVCGPCCVGKSYVIRMLMKLFGQYFTDFPRLTCRNLGPMDDRTKISKVSLRRFFYLLQRRRCLATSMTDITLWLDPVTDNILQATGKELDVDNIKLERYLSMYLLHEIEKKVETAEIEGKFCVVELQIWDAIAWKAIFPNSLIFPLIAKLSVIAERLEEKFRKNDSYDMARKVEGFNARRTPHVLRKVAASKILPNNTEMDAARNAELIHQVCRSLKEER